MNEHAAKLYLDLMKNTLSFSLWEEPGMPIELFAYKKNRVRRVLTLQFVKFLRSMRYQMVKLPNLTSEERAEGKLWPRYAETMVGLKRLNNIQFCVEQAIKDQVPGDLVETGVWRGGSTILMKAILSAYEDRQRRVFVADSFEGLPKPDEKKYPLDAGDIHYTEEFLAVSVETVKDNFRKYGLLDENVVFLKGWFKDTLPTAPIEKIAVLRMDGDMYESTRDVITNLYTKLSPGGFCIVDDYQHTPCKKAVDEYREEHGINSSIEKIDWTGAFWRKE